MKKMYYVRTNAYDCIITDDGECRRVYDTLPAEFTAGFENAAEDAARIIEDMADWYDDSFWDLYEESIEALTEGAEILSVIDAE